MTAVTVPHVSLGPPARRAPPFSGIWFRYAGAVLVFFLLFANWQYAPVPFPVHLTVVALAALCMLPLTLWRARGGPGVPIFELICISYGIQYTVPIYLLPNQIIIKSTAVAFSWDEIQATVMVAFVGIACMIAAYYAFERFAAHRIPQVRLRIQPSRVGQFAVFGIVFGLLPHIVQTAGYQIPGASVSAEFLRILSFQAYVGLAVLAYSYYGGELRGRKWQIFLLGTCFGFALLGLVGGLLEDAFIPLVIIFVVRWQTNKKLPVSWLVIGLTMFIVLNGVKAEYRSAAWYGSAPSGIVSRLGLWSSLVGGQVQTILNGDVATEVNTTMTPAASRLDLVHQFALMRRLTPVQVPYYEGWTYQYLFFGWVPRFVWSDKQNPGYEDFVMAQDYGLYINGETGGTSIGIGQLNETYANFGLFGIIFIMGLHGIFYGTMRRLFDDTGANGSQAIYLATMVFFFNGIGSSTSLLVSGAVENSLVSSLILRFVVPRTPSKPPRLGPERAVIEST